MLVILVLSCLSALLFICLFVCLAHSFVVIVKHRLILNSFASLTNNSIGLHSSQY